MVSYSPPEDRAWPLRDGSLVTDTAALVARVRPWLLSGQGGQGAAGQTLCTCWKSAALGDAAPALPPRRSSGLCQVSLGRPEGPTLLKRHQTPVQRECRGCTGEPKRPLT